MSDAGRASLSALAVLDEDASLEQLALSARELGDRVMVARTVAEALALAERRAFDVALVDVSLDQGEALALVHHIPALSPGVRVVACAARDEMARGADALSMGADALYPLPLTGDAAAGALAETRRRIGATRELEARRAREALVARALHAANLDGPGVATRILLEDLVRRSAARGLTVSGATPEGAFARAGEEGAEPAGSLSYPLQLGGEDVGVVVAHPPLDGPAIEAELGLLALLGAAATRGSGPPHLLAEARAELRRARRYGRRVTVVVVSGASASTAARLARTIVRTSDRVAVIDDRLVLLLPETGAFGARSLLGRLELAPDAHVGLATFPHDGGTVEALLEAARSRCDLAASAMDELEAVSTLGELAAAASGPPPLRATTPAPPLAPVDLPVPGLLALVEAACAEAARGGTATFLATAQPDHGLGDAPRVLARLAAPQQLDRRGDRRARAASPAPVRIRDLRDLPGCADAFAAVVRAEHGTWATCGRLVGGRYLGLHSALDAFADQIMRLVEPPSRDRP